MAISTTMKELEGLLETWDIMSDPEEMEAIRIGMQEMKNGETVSLEEFIKSLGL